MAIWRRTPGHEAGPARTRTYEYDRGGTLKCMRLSMMDQTLTSPLQTQGYQC